MKIFKILLFTALAISSLGIQSCTKGFEELNTDPNTSHAAVAEQLLAPALYDVVTRNQTRSLRLNNELMQVHVTTLNSDEIHRYVIRPTESDYMWNNWYLQRTNFLDMYKSADVLNNKTFMGIARILDVWVTSLITDTYGDVPYSEANRGKENLYLPKFDSQKDIYLDLFAKLEEANTLLTGAASATLEQAGLDPLYGPMAKDKDHFATLWRKFGNTLYLRLLMRTLNKQEVDAASKIREILETNASNYPVFADNSESAILRFTTTAPYVSAFNTYRDYDFNGDNGLSTFFINNLKEWQDPRIDKWATKYQNQYEGISSGYADGQIPTRMSAYQPALKNEPLLGNIINYPELQFMLAELALKGVIAGDPKTYYNKGVESAISLWGLEVPVGHLEKESVRWDDAVSFEVKMEQIITQKYYTLFFTDFQQWFEHRRTGYPTLPIGPGVQNGGQMPSRFLYPVYVQSYNAANYTAAVVAMGGDDLNTKVWWDK